MENNYSFKVIPEKQRKEIIKLYSEVFNDTKMFGEILLHNAFDGSMAYETNAEGRVSAMGFSRAKKMRFFDKIINFPYICCIGTAETERGKGLATIIINKLINSFKGKYPFVMLCPAKESLYNFYAKFGFRVFDYKLSNISEVFNDKDLTTAYPSDSDNKKITKDNVTIYNDKRIENNNSINIDMKKTGNSENLIILEKIEDLKEEYIPPLAALFSQNNEKYAISQYRTEGDMAERLSEILLGGGRLEFSTKNGLLSSYKIYEEGLLIEEMPEKYGAIAKKIVADDGMLATDIADNDSFSCIKVKNTMILVLDERKFAELCGDVDFEDLKTRFYDKY